MASQGSKSFASLLLVVNLLMYAVVTIIAGWALNYGINETPREVSEAFTVAGEIESHRAQPLCKRRGGCYHGWSHPKHLVIPARLFPIYYPMGNMATGFFVIFSLVAGIVGVATSLTGLQDVYSGTRASMLSAAASSVVAWGLTLLAMGLACKEISIGWRSASLRTMETLTIILSGTQLLCAGAIHSGA